MKLILTLFLLSILGQIQLLNGQCFDLIRQYNRCKHLKMEYQKSSYIDQDRYFVNYTANSDLTDRFYRKLISKEMNFNKAMKLFRKIYTETDNCTSEFCKCVSLGVIDYNGNYSLYFRNKDVFPHVKRIIEDFNKKFESKLIPYSEIWYFNEFEPNYNQNLSSLAQFCIKYDYSYNRYKYYNKSNDGRFYRIQDIISEYGCFWDVLFERKTLDFKKLNNSDLGRLLECQIKRAISYSSTREREDTRFLAITMWATTFPNFIWDKNMTAQIDSFISNDFEYRYKPDLFLSAKLNTYSYTKIIFIENTKNYKYNTIDLNGETKKRYIYKVFDSPTLRIDCEWALSNDDELIWEWANFTFKFNDSTSRTISANMSFDKYKLNPFGPEIDISNGTLISERIQITKSTFIKREYFLIVDYKYNITVKVYLDQINLYFPPQMQNQTSGLMIDELQNNNLIERKKRSTDSVYPFELSCQTMCEKNKNTFTVMDKMDSLIASEIDFNYCLNDCFKQHLEKLK